MLSTEEKRFISSWEEQRKDGKWSYFWLYFIVGIFITTIIGSVFMLIFFQIVFGSLFFWIVLTGAVAISFIFTLYSWNSNERKYHKILRRESAGGRIEEL
jgi:hypothetical protein